MRRSCRIRSGMRYFAKCYTIARTLRFGRSSIAKSAPRLNASVQRGAPVAAVELAMHFELGREPMAALRYYAEAAEAALAHFSPEECMRIIERASPLLEQVPDGLERNALQITIGTLHGLAATRVLGAGIEAKSALQRAYSLLDEAPQHPMRGRLLHGFGWMLCLRAEYAEALAVADRAEALGSTTNDPLLMSTACTVHGEVDQLQGRSRAARTWLERGLALAERLDVGPGEFLVDPQVALLGLARQPARSSGPGRGARARACSAHIPALANGDGRWPRSSQSGTARCSRCGSATPSVWPPLPMRCARLWTNSRSLTVELRVGGFAPWRMPEWGHRATPINGFGSAYEDNVRLGMLAGASETLGYAAEALFLAGDLDGAQRQLDEALQIADQLERTRVSAAAVSACEAAIARARGDRVAADAAIRGAIAEARAQEAPWLELMALIELCDRHSATAERPTRACRARRPASRSEATRPQWPKRETCSASKRQVNAGRGASAERRLSCASRPFESALANCASRIGQSRPNADVSLTTRHAACANV